MYVYVFLCGSDPLPRRRMAAGYRVLFADKRGLRASTEGTRGWLGRAERLPSVLPLGASSSRPPGEGPGQQAGEGAPGGEGAWEMAGNDPGAETPPWVLRVFSQSPAFSCLPPLLLQWGEFARPYGWRAGRCCWSPRFWSRGLTACAMLRRAGPHSPPRLASPSPRELRRGHTVSFFPSRTSVGDTPCTASSFF